MPELQHNSFIQEGCLPTKNLSCQFSTSFTVDFGSSQDLLQKQKAKAIFEYFGTRWINSCVSNNVSYFGLYLDGTSDEEHGARNLSWGSGSTSGKCSGIDCPSDIQFSFPDRRLQLRSHKGLQECNGHQLVEGLLVYPDFTSDTNGELSSGNVIFDTEHVIYEHLDECNRNVCNSPQRDAARAFLRKANLQHFIDENQHECAWEGIHCDSNRLISSIFLRGKGVNGKIASEIGSLTNLKFLDLADNSINGRIPSQIGRLTRLNSLSLNDNNLTGNLPREITALENCKHDFTLGRNKMSGDMSFFCPKDERGHGCGDVESNDIFSSP